MAGESEEKEKVEGGEKGEEEVEKRIKKLEERLVQTERKAEDYLNQLMYMKADFENYKKREKKKRDEEVRQEVERFVARLLEVLDNLERALESARATRKKKPLVEGIEMVHSQFLQLLNEKGVEEIDALECEFDPNQHECVAVEEAQNGGDNEVVEVLQKGYKFKGRVIRSAKVKVAKKR